MEPRDTFKNLSPLDHRYYQANRELFEKLSFHLSEEAVVRTCIEAETALLKAHLAEGGAPETGSPALDSEIDAAAATITPDAVYEEEEKTQHNIRALVNVMKRRMPENIRHFVHLGATSVDILDTSAALRVRGAVREVILPLLIELEERLCTIAADEADTVEVGRTHGQFAVPITFGFAIGEYVSRLGKSIIEIDSRSRDLRGKLSGAVGAYNATSIVTSDPRKLEKVYLGFLGLEPSEHSTQLVEPEYLLRLLLELNVCFGIIANLADDLRNLQRSEIDEVREVFGDAQVGSSTMPQKRNPWNSEHVKSLWKAFAPRVLTFYMDQISEHQRDLTNSASSRFVADYLAGFTAAANRMLKVVGSLKVDRRRMEQTVKRAGAVFAEPAYILLALSGEPDAHEVLRRITLDAERIELEQRRKEVAPGAAQNESTEGTDDEPTAFLQALKSRPEIWERIAGRLRKVGFAKPEAFFSDPAEYTGIARRRAAELAEKYRNEMTNLKERCNDT